MVVVSTMREPGAAGIDDASIVHELIPTTPSGTVVEVVVVVDVVDVEVVVVVPTVGVGAGAGAGAAVVVVTAVVVGAVVSIVTELASALDVGPVFPEESDTAFAARRVTTVPSLEHVTETVMLVPELVFGVNTQPVAVPASLLKSSAAIPLTDSLNARV
jgi:hypothetical protein